MSTIAAMTPTSYQITAHDRGTAVSVDVLAEDEVTASVTIWPALTPQALRYVIGALEGAGLEPVDATTALMAFAAGGPADANAAAERVEVMLGLPAACVPDRTGETGGQA